MNPINYPRLASIALFSIWIGGFAVAHDSANHIHKVAAQVPVVVSQGNGEMNESQGVVGQVPAAVSQFNEELVVDQGAAGQVREENNQVISRAQFTTQVVNREPIDQLDSIDASVSPIYFFTELTNLSGQTVTHRWLYNGTNMAEVKIMLNADRWRAHSTKNMMPNWTGTWAVAVVDEEGNEITRKKFDYVTSIKTANMVETKNAME